MTIDILQVCQLASLTQCGKTLHLWPKIGKNGNSFYIYVSMYAESFN